MKTLCIYLFLLMVTTFSGVSMESAVTYELYYNQQMDIGNGLSVSYSFTGHEHVSHGPDEVFSATVAVYCLKLETQDLSEDLYFYIDMHDAGSGASLEWHGYRIQVLPESSAEKILFYCCMIKESRALY